MSSEVHVVKGVPEDVKTVDVSVKFSLEIKYSDGLITGCEGRNDQGRYSYEKEDTTFDGGFIKVEKEGTNTKADEKAEKQVLTERISPSSSQREQRESQGMVKALELELNQELHDLRGKVSEQESINLKLREELKEKELLVALSKDQEGKIKTANEKLTKVKSLAEENSQVNEIHQSTKNELINIQEHLGVEKSKLDAMASEIKKLTSVASEKSVLESKFDEVEKQLKSAEAQLKEEVEKVAELTLKLHEHETKASEQDSVDEEEAMKLHKSNLQETETMGKGEVDVKSRDNIDFSFPTPKQRKSKEESDHASASHSSSSSGNVTTTQKAETSHLMTLKIVLGVALVSVIIGIILGKKY
ncbi:hypothetical protein Bca52824_079605 [Brassica carinata]|uniref:Uncharacterized protein n=1 Tax=Brassica carinata TaxID=52824 RepID=A0A8X7U0W5_BRACI|nr:hypothetical protein Bca52824_079605 [Brassica carinata]